MLTARQRLKSLIGVVFEEQYLYERLPGLYNLRYNCGLYDLPEKRIEEVLAPVGLTERAKNPLRAYSKAMNRTRCSPNL